MAFADDKTLAARPDLFELVEAPEKTRLFKKMAFIVPVIPLAFSVWAWIDDSMFMFIAALVMAVGSVFVFLNMAKNARQWARRGGTPLLTGRINIDDDPQEARERLATRDPNRYTPLKVASTASEHQLQWIEYFWPESERVTYVVVVERSNRIKEPPPIVELRDRQHDEFHAAVEAGLGRPYGDRPAPGLERH